MYNMKVAIGLVIDTSVIFGIFISVSLIANADQNHITNIHNSENVNVYTKCQNPVVPNTYCFQKGDYGDYIRNISVLLSELGYYRGKPKRLFDHEIQKSVIKFQKKNQMKPADGIVDFNTLFWLCKAHTGSGCTATAERWRHGIVK
jgi:Putative peptidoglycan binding domain